MSSDIFTELVNIAKNQSYIHFKLKVTSYTYNYILMSSLESWFTMFSNKCSRCNNNMILIKNGEYSIYFCEKCELQYKYFYKHLEEDYMRKTFMYMLL
jgi:hypothetical protein